MRLSRGAQLWEENGSGSLGGEVQWRAPLLCAPQIQGPRGVTSWTRLEGKRRMVGTEKTSWEFSPGWLSPATLRAAGTSDTTCGVLLCGGCRGSENHQRWPDLWLLGLILGCRGWLCACWLWDPGLITLIILRVDLRITRDNGTVSGRASMRGL